MYGHVSDFDTITEANFYLKKGWRDRACHISHPSGDWLEISDYEGNELDHQIPFAHGE